MIKPQKFKAIFSKKEKISSKVYEVRLKLADPPEIQFQAGHTIMIHMTESVNRSMSIASAPNDKTELTLCWDVSPMGVGCQWMLSRKIGEEVTFMGPLGVFLYDPQSPRRSIFVATGTGVAPFKSALEEYLAGGLMQQPTLYWGLRHEEDIFWNERFEELARVYPDFQFKISLSQPIRGWTGRQGHVNDHVFAEEADLATSDIYLCGSGNMVNDMFTALVAHGVPEPQVKKELFFKN